MFIVDAIRGEAGGQDAAKIEVALRRRARDWVFRSEHSQNPIVVGAWLRLSDLSLLPFLSFYSAS
jgi:hypothetical protein